MLLGGYELNVEKVAQKFVEFKELQMNWPEVSNLKDLDNAKTLFRLANT